MGTRIALRRFVAARSGAPVGVQTATVVVELGVLIGLVVAFALLLAFAPGA